jgi:hypothetical protein
VPVVVPLAVSHAVVLVALALVVAFPPPYRALFLYQWNLCHQFGNRYRNRDIYQYLYYLQ